jgi:hypothetical protein
MCACMSANLKTGRHTLSSCNVVIVIFMGTTNVHWCDPQTFYHIPVQCTRMAAHRCESLRASAIPNSNSYSYSAKIDTVSVLFSANDLLHCVHANGLNPVQGSNVRLPTPTKNQHQSEDRKTTHDNRKTAQKKEPVCRLLCRLSVNAV